MKVPMVDVVGEHQRFSQELERAVLSALRSGRYILGPNLQEFERELAAYVGVKKAVGASSGTMALWLVLRALGIGPGDEVITTPFTFAATAEVIALVGAKVVFADVDYQTRNISAEEIARNITPETRAVIVVHLYGLPVDMDSVASVLAGKGIVIIEDAAQALGSRYKNRMVGTLGRVAATSFFPSKNLGAAGDSGAILTDDEDLAERIRMIRNHGSKQKYKHEIMGFNGRMNELQAAYLRTKLRFLPFMLEERRQVAFKYIKAFRDAGLEEYFDLPEEPHWAHHTFHQFTITMKNPRWRDALREFLAGKEIATAVHYPVPLHLQPSFAYLGYSKGDFPNAEALSERVVSLPIYPLLHSRTDLQDYVIDSVIEFFRKRV